MSRPQMHSPIHRARESVVTWLEVLPEAMQLDAIMALDRLVQVAENQVNEAYSDGYRSRREVDSVRKLKDEAAQASAEG